LGEASQEVLRLLRAHRFLPSPRLDKDPFEGVIGIAKSGIKDGFSNHNRYLYGRKR